MTPSSLFNMLQTGQNDFDTTKIKKFTRLDGGAIELDLSSGAHGVFRIDPRTKKRYLILEWTDQQFRANMEARNETDS